MKEEIKLSFHEPKKPNWFKRLFMPNRYKRSYSFGSFIWMLFHDKKEYDALKNYGWEISSHNCDLFNKFPSKRLWRRYGLSPESMNGFAWWLMEQYEKGNLIEKPKEDAQPKP